MIGSNYPRSSDAALTPPGQLLKQWDYTYGMVGRSSRIVSGITPRPGMKGYIDDSEHVSESQCRPSDPVPLLTRPDQRTAGAEAGDCIPCG